MRSRASLSLLVIGLAAAGAALAADADVKGQNAPAEIPRQALDAIVSPSVRAADAQALARSAAGLNRAAIVGILLKDPTASATLERIANSIGLKASDLAKVGSHGGPAAAGSPALIIQPTYDAWAWNAGIRFPAAGDLPGFMADGHAYNLGWVDGEGAAFPIDPSAARTGCIEINTKHTFAELWLDAPPGPALYAITIHLSLPGGAPTLSAWLRQAPPRVTVVVNGTPMSLVASPSENSVTGLVTMTPALRGVVVAGQNMRSANCNLWARIEEPPGVTYRRAIFGGFTITRM